MTLGARLAAYATLPQGRRLELARSALDDPASFPIRGTARDAALAIRAEGPREPQVGGTVFLVYDPRGEAVAIRAFPSPARSTRPLGLVGDALSTARRARAIAIRDAASLRRPFGATRPVRWFGRVMAPLNVHGADRYDGPSYGLAMTLGELSALEGRALLPHVIALGCVAEDGSVLRVDGLEAKCAVVRDWLLGVDIVLVASGEAERVRPLLGPEITAVEVRDVLEARAIAFGEARTRDASLEETDAKALLTLALQYRPAEPQWKAIAARAERLLDAGGDGAREPSKVTRLSRAIVERHLGGAPDARAFEDLRALPRTLALRVRAHHLQALADEPTDEMERLAEAALIDLSAVDGTREERIVMGAAARCLAVRRHRDGARWSQRATEGWFANLEILEASFAMCTWIRCLGVLGDRDGLERAVDEYVDTFLDAAREEPVSSAFVLFELGRALSLAGEHDRAIATLLPLANVRDGAPTDRLVPHALRWIARSRAASGDLDEAERAWGQLDGLSARRVAAVDMQVRLGRLDRAIFMGAGGEADLVRSVLEHPTRGRLARAVLGEVADGPGAAEWLVRGYPY